MPASAMLLHKALTYEGSSPTILAGRLSSNGSRGGNVEAPLPAHTDIYIVQTFAINSFWQIESGKEIYSPHDEYRSSH
eukprot:scaffold296812_cov42-Prasinocladus_malaysianus.AAC.1